MNQTSACAIAVIVACIIAIAVGFAYRLTHKGSDNPRIVSSSLGGDAAFVTTIALDDIATNCKIWMAHEDPPIRVCDGFMSGDEAKAIIAEFEPSLSRSTLLQENGSSSTGSARTSFTSFLPPGDESSTVSPASRAIGAVERRASLLLGVPVSHLETLQLLRYTEGQLYKPHHDYFKDSTDKNNRIATILVYLNDLPSDGGGETRFPELEVVVVPRLGRAVSWHNCVARGDSVVCDSRTLHGGDPPKNGNTKYALNIWARGLPVR